MKTAIVIIASAIGLLLGSCALPPAVTRPEAMPGAEAGAGRLLHLRIERWDTLRFSGLLGLRGKGAELYYVLLDATGVKLIEAEVAGDESYKLLQVSGPMRQSDFAPFLSQALARIYLQEPDRLPCAGSWLYRICREGSAEGGSRKYGQAGPFEVWRVSSRAADRESEAAAVTYHQPWLGVRILLERAAAGR
jgi:hypothetical protein